MAEGKQKEKRWDRFTWTVLIGSLVIFFIISIGLALYLDNLRPWRPAVPVIVGFAIFFLLVGIFLRSKFGRLAF